MKKLYLTFIVLCSLSLLLYITLGGKAAVAAKPEIRHCTPCHIDFTAILPKGHPQVKGNDITSCLGCHPSDTTDKPEPSTFFSRIHRAHLSPKVKLECTVCHIWTPGKRFALRGQKQSTAALSRSDMTLHKNIFASWSDSPYLDSLHGSKNVTCNGCHGTMLPKPDDTVDSERCLKCHGPLENLIAKTVPKDFPDRNPHKSHLGEIACTVCHQGHSESSVYCLNCHKNFKMKIRW